MIMRRVIAIAAAGASLAGCSSFSFDAFRSTPPTVQVQLESVPSGADALTSLGPGCKTPCSLAVSVPQPGGRGTSAGGSTAEGGAESAEAEKAKTQSDSRGTCLVALPRSGTSARAGHAQPLTGRTAPDSGLYANRIMHRLRVAEL